MGGEGMEEASASVVPSIDIPITEALGNGTSILIGMPGAFTPTCSDEHLPGYLKNAAKLAAAGVQKLAVVTTNDRFVNDAWKKNIAACAGGKEDTTLQMFSDGDGDLVRALGLVDDMGFGLGFRSKRFALLCEDGVIKHVAVDEGMDELKATSAEAMLELVSPEPAPVDNELLIDQEKAGALVLAAVALAAVLYYSSQ